ncbi:hypothetical protein EV145_11841 [Flavobacterium sp. 245]|nr:hypothetical protein EV145_11841 [Flavobacterium sp. 245]
MFVFISILAFPKTPFLWTSQSNTFFPENFTPYYITPLFSLFPPFPRRNQGTKSLFTAFPTRIFLYLYIRPLSKTTSLAPIVVKILLWRGSPQKITSSVRYHSCVADSGKQLLIKTNYWLQKLPPQSNVLNPYSHIL